MDSIIKNQQAPNDVVAALTKNPKKNHDPSMEREDPRRALDGMFLDAPTCCRQIILPPQMENFIANVKREIAKDRHSSTNKARVCDQGGPDKAHTHPEEKCSTSRAKTRSFPSASWLTLMISASEAKTKSYVYGQRVRRPWKRQGASRVLRVIHQKDLHVVHQVGARIQSMEDMAISFWWIVLRVSTYRAHDVLGTSQATHSNAEYAILLSLQKGINTQNDLQHLLIVAWRNVRARKKLDVVVRIFSSTIIKPFNASSCSSLLSLLTLRKEGRQGKKEARLLNEMMTPLSSTSSTSWLLSLTLHHQILPHPGCCRSHCTRNGLLPRIFCSANSFHACW
ncbi:uncharacterized protein G2W53_003077 [Senna tora]|uniref:Uncharacterized protein n=1 Tax=Senna tora TaxID=362788 RepID=A0A835CFZ6_9FABA|nr:uncharacterized protein G2W53_003077 [Senna tora]